ncbi:unnamed protein product [Owenia fusiformis]|uniref:Mitochondrial ribosomal protein L13 n=1 Tax=Owenia fusiformis TaxID=6347 RepID=A0A8S4MZP2_OWEFU|nr:unnamed protein product [Owenia fusiformis]
MSMKRVQQWATFSRFWWIYDAKFQSPFKSAPRLCFHLLGKHKPIYYPTSDVGDHIVVINTKHIAMKNDYWRTFTYFHHTGYPKGFSKTRAWEVHEADPTRIMRLAVRGWLKGNLDRPKVMERLHCFPEEDVPEEILKNVSGQIPQVFPIPKSLEEYTMEERENFPRLIEWPEEYVQTDKKTNRPGPKRERRDTNNKAMKEMKTFCVKCALWGVSLSQHLGICCLTRMMFPLTSNWENDAGSKGRV